MIIIIFLFYKNILLAINIINLISKKLYTFFSCVVKIVNMESLIKTRYKYISHSFNKRLLK